MAFLLVTPGVYASVETETLTMLDRMAEAKAIKPESLEAPTLVASLCGMLHPDEHSGDSLDKAVRILLRLTACWATICI